MGVHALFLIEEINYQLKKRWKRNPNTTYQKLGRVDCCCSAALFHLHHELRFRRNFDALDLNSGVTMDVNVDHLTQ